jgi:hypothetical protein
MHDIHTAPELVVERWFNTPAPLTLAGLRKRVVLIYAFQMLCRGCVEHSIPQAKWAHGKFASVRLQVLGLHSVFERHDVMNAEALRMFVEQNGLHFPVAIDAPSPNSSIPQTMRRYDMQGTPTFVAIDASGRRRYQHFGHLGGAQVEAIVAELLAV